MAIRIKHGKPKTIISAAKQAGEARIGAQLAQAAMERATRLQEKEMEFDFRRASKQQDLAIDLQMQERAKMWELEKMETRSRLDFQREEQQRQRELDRIDSAIQQVDKEVLAGRLSEQEAYPIKLKLEISKSGINIPAAAFAVEEDRYGVMPYWMRGKDAPEGTPERELYEAEMKLRTEGRAGTIPYHLSTEFLRSLPSATAQDMLADKGIFFDSDEEFEAWLTLRESAAPTKAPLSGKSLDVGTQIEIGGEEILVTSPTGKRGTIPAEDLDEALTAGYTIATDIEVPVTELPTTEPTEEKVPFGITTPPPLTLYRLIREYYKLPKKVRKAKREERVRKGIERSPLYRVGK